jgi:hypothetical protein
MSYVAPMSDALRCHADDEEGTEEWRQGVHSVPSD